MPLEPDPGDWGHRRCLGGTGLLATQPPFTPSTRRTPSANAVTTRNAARRASGVPEDRLSQKPKQSYLHYLIGVRGDTFRRIRFLGSASRYIGDDGMVRCSSKVDYR